MASPIVLISRDADPLHVLGPALTLGNWAIMPAPPGPDALRRCVTVDPEIVLVSHDGHPGEWQFLERLLAVLQCPVFLLLPCKDAASCARALEMGADECMAHPIDAIELVARVRAVLRRGRGRGRDPARERNYYEDGDLVVDLTRREAWRSDEPLTLTRIEMGLLACLVRHEGESLSREQLIAQVWGSADGSSSESLRQHMHNLRQKLEPEPCRPRRIVARRGEGYQLRRVLPQRPVGWAALVDQEVPIEPLPPR